MPFNIERRELLTCLSISAASFFVSPRSLAGEKNFTKKITKKTYTYKTVGKLDIKLDVHRPDDGVVRPVIVWIHGGALIMGSRSGVYQRVKQDFLDAGSAIVSIDYRLAPETKLPAIIEDVEDAYAWVHANGPTLFHADTRKIAVLGGSAGGYLTLSCGFRAKPRPAALVAFWGYGDLVGPWYSQPSEFYRRRPLVSESDAFKGVSGSPVADGTKDAKLRSAFYLYCRQNGLWPKLVSGLDPYRQAKAYDPYMPVLNVSDRYPPTMLIHGTADTDVPYEQSVLMDRLFDHHDVPHKFITVSGAGHGLSGGDAKLIDEAYAQVLPFVQQYVNGD